MRKKVNSKKLIAGLVLLLILFLLSVVLSFERDSAYGDAVIPVRTERVWGSAAEKGDTTIGELDFSRKKVSSLTKYGFRRPFTLEKTSKFFMVLQEGLPSDTPYNGIKFGLYRDKELTDAIAEVDLQESMTSELWETTTEERGYVEETLEPGTYYIAAYTTHYWDSFRIAFERGYTVM